MRHYVVCWVQQACKCKNFTFDFLHFSAFLDRDTNCGAEITPMSGLVFKLFAVKHSCKCTFVKTSRAANL